MSEAERNREGPFPKHLYIFSLDGSVCGQAVTATMNIGAEIPDCIAEILSGPFTLLVPVCQYKSSINCS